MTSHDYLLNALSLARRYAEGGSVDYDPLDATAYEDAGTRKDAARDATWDVLSALGLLTPIGGARSVGAQAMSNVPVLVEKAAAKLPMPARSSYEAIYKSNPFLFDRELRQIYPATSNAAGTVNSISGPSLLEMIDRGRYAMPLNWKDKAELAARNGLEMARRPENLVPGTAMGLASDAVGYGPFELGQLLGGYLFGTPDKRPLPSYPPARPTMD